MTRFAPVFRRAGLLELNIGDRRVAIEHLNQAVTIDTGDIGARLSLARESLLSNNLPAAEEHVTQILSRYPQQLGANILRADIALLKGDTENAKVVYDFLAKNYPQSPTGYYKLGLVEEKNKNIPKAIEDYKKAIETDVAVLAPAQRLSRLLAKTKGVDGAIADFLAFLEKSKSSKPEFKLLIGSLQMGDLTTPEKVERAKKYLTEAVEARPALTGAYFALAALDARSGDLEKSAESYEKLLVKNPGHIPSSMLLAMIREKQGKFDKAVLVYREILKGNPQFAPASNNIAWLIAVELKGDLDEALDFAQKAKQADADEPGITDTLGWIHHLKGSSKIALALIEESLALYKKNGKEQPDPEVFYHLGEIKLALNDAEGARKAFNEALTSTELSPQTRKKIEVALQANK